MEVSGHSLFLLQQLNVQREFGFLCDCTVAIGNVYFKAHRAVLAAFSNYFKMIFIHQSSECIKIQPTDIQPDVFSYLLHIMYTGTGPKQQVEPGRLQEGIKFLHAYQLRRTPNDGNQDTAAIAQDALRMSNLYGIQISSQSAAKEGPVQKGASVRGVGGARGERPRGCVQPAPPTAPELRRVSSVACGEDPVAAVTVKQEQVETEVSGERAEPGTGVAGMGAGPRGSPAPKTLSPVGRDGCDTPRETLCGHFLARAESASKGEEPEEELEGSGDRLLGGGGRSPSSRESEAGSAGLEEALRQSRALAEELAAELRGGAVGGVGGCSPRSRKRRMACAVCGLRFAHKAQLQEHAHSHAGTRGTRYHRYSRLCSQLIQASQHLCDSQAGLAAETSPRDVPDNSSSCYSLDSEVSQESIDTFAVE